MARIAQSRNLKGFGWLTKKRTTYHRDVAKERRELKRDAMEARKERIALKELEAKERAADARIAAAQRKIETAAKKTDTGRMSEARFEAMKARMEKEIEKQEQFKAAALAKVNPSWGYGIYQGTGFATDQVAHFKSRVAAETYARSKGLTGYTIRRSFAKNPCASTRKSQVTDRARRYRANQRGCKPAGAKKCKLCGSKSDVMVDHVDGNESNGRKSNLRWLCRSCNTVLGAEMARTGQGRRTVQYNPAHKGAQTLGEYMQAVLQHTRGAHDDGGRIIHNTPKRKREEFASEIWAARKARGNPAVSAEQYRLAQAVLSGTARQTHMSPEAAREIVDRTPAKLRSEYSRRNPAMEFSTEYHLGYNLGQADRQSANLRKTLDELHATFAANFTPGSLASWESFEQAYQAGYGGQMGAAAPNPENPKTTGQYASQPEAIAALKRKGKQGTGAHVGFDTAKNKWVIVWPQRNPEPDSEEYEQARKIAELFHGRPVKEEITVTESIREHDWLWRIGPLVKLKIRTLTKRSATLPFHQTEEGMVHLFCSPDGRQFYLRGGDQELDLKALGMGEGTEWYRDHMLIGEAKEITYRDKKKFHKFKLTDYFHKLGEVTKKKPMLAYNALAHKMEILGGQYKVETDDLVDGMSPGIVN
jgi:hypothetical protein